MGMSRGFAGQVRRRGSLHNSLSKNRGKCLLPAAGAKSTLEPAVQGWVQKVGQRVHLTPDPASKDPVDHGGLGELYGGLGATHADVALMHCIQQGNQVLMCILLPPQPETARHT